MEHITDFVLKHNLQLLRTRFTLKTIDGSPNIEFLHIPPPLNRHGLRMLAKHLNALADLLDGSHP